jgi:hypothetical protein
MEAGAETSKVNKEGKTIFYFVKKKAANEEILKHLQMPMIMPVKKLQSQKTITVLVDGHGINYGKIIEYPDPRVRILSKVAEGCIDYGINMRERITDVYNSSPDPNISSYKKLEFVQNFYNKGREKKWPSIMHRTMQSMIDKKIKERDEAINSSAQDDPIEIAELNEIIKRDTIHLQYTKKQENANAVNTIETFSVDNSVSFEEADLEDPGIHVIDIINNPDVDKYFQLDDNLAKEKYCIDIHNPELNKQISDRLEFFFSNLIRVDEPSRQFTIDKLQNMGIDENTALGKSTPSISNVCETIKSLKQLYANRDAIIKENNNSPDLPKELLDMITFRENLLSSLSNRLKIYAYIFLKNLFTTAEQISNCFREYRTNPDTYGFLKDFVPIETDFNDMLSSIEQMSASRISHYDDNSLIKKIWLTSLVEKLQKYGFTVINIILESCRVNFDNSIKSYEDYEEKVNKTLSDARNVGNVGVFQWAEKKYMDTRKIGGRRRKSFKKGRKSFKKGIKPFSRRRKTFSRKKLLKNEKKGA